MTSLARPLRSALAAGLLLVALLAAPAGAEWRHGLSLMGTPRYPAGFPHFDYVDPAAPKGGVVRMAANGTFDNLNPVVAGVRGNVAAGLDLMYDSLMSSSLDEVGTAYGLLAEAVTFPPDVSSVTYRLRPEARWHDGRPVTVEDVVWSFEMWTTHSPNLKRYYQHVTKAEKTGEREVTFRFDQSGNRELPQIVGEFQVLPKHWWEGTGPDGRKRDIGQTTLEIPLGGGAYRIARAEPGRSVVYERVPDYWGHALPVNIGINNFGEVRFEYFRDATVALEAFKADALDVRFENSARNWATAYDFPAVRDNKVVIERFPIKNLGQMQAFVFNLRRGKFQDWRVRRAFDLAFDFEEMNRTIFFGQYRRIGSYFENTELASSGVPQGKELEILETVRDKVPPALFTEPYRTPQSGTPEQSRSNVREAIRLLREAGWEVRDKRLVDTRTGEAMSVEILIDTPTFERVVLIYKPMLERLGVEVRVRTVDDAQYENRLRQFDFDIVIHSWGQSLSPGNEQRFLWGSAAADTPGTGNVAGIKNPAVDALIERVIFAKDRDELVAATRALDRVLLWNHFVVPQWTYGFQRTARWDRFGRPAKLPEYGASGFPTVWWFDAEKAQRIGARP